MHIEFNASPGPSLGVEMELQLIDRTTRGLTPVAVELLDELGRASGGEHPKAKHELFQSCVEVITGVCDTVNEAHKDLNDTIEELRRAAERRDVTLMCAGSHPFSNWQERTVSPDQRYHDLIGQMGWMAQRLQIFGIHIHVGVRSAEKSIAIANAVTQHLPHLLALSASSPYWQGADSGLASARTKVFEGLPTAGLPERLGSWAEFETFMTTLVNAGAIRTIREVWWDVRPHPGFGTVELRMCDGIPNLNDVVAVAAMSQCLVAWFDQLIDRGYTLPSPSSWSLRQNKWRAARHGLDADIITDAVGSTQPIRASLDDLLDELTPVARRLRCLDELGHIRTMVDRDTSAARQRSAVADGASLIDVVDALCDELVRGAPTLV